MLMDKFLNDAKEFSKINNYEKFFSLQMRLSNGNTTKGWFDSRKAVIEKSSDPICKDIMKQYEVAKELKFFAEAEEFYNIEGIEKFDNDIIMSCGRSTSSWFYDLYYGKVPVESSHPICVKIMEQYEKAKELKFLAEAEEFYKIEGYEKFDSEDGIPNYKCANMASETSASSWWHHNASKVRRSSADICKKIMEQYDELRQARPKNKGPRIGFSGVNLDDVEAFLNNNNPRKFGLTSDIKLPSGITSGRFFSNEKNRKYMMGMPDGRFNKQYKQYELLVYTNYKNSFYREESFDKFCSYGNKRFSDGTSMSDWFKNNKDRIEKVAMKHEDSTEAKIMAQYRDYEEICKLKREFIECSDFNKFSDSIVVKFNSGALMNAWWGMKQDEILASELPDDIEIQSQYEVFMGRISAPHRLVLKNKNSR